MYGIYLTVVKHKDHFVFAFAVVVSTFTLLNNESPKMSIIRGKATDVVSFFSSPFAWVQSLMFLEKENKVLREKNLDLSLQVESMLNLQIENNELKGYELRQLENKKKVVQSLKNMKFKVFASGDSYNDIQMLQEADMGVFFQAPKHIRDEFKDIEVVESHADLKNLLIENSSFVGRE